MPLSWIFIYFLIMAVHCEDTNNPPLPEADGSIGETAVVDVSINDGPETSDTNDSPVPPIAAPANDDGIDNVNEPTTTITVPIFTTTKINKFSCYHCKNCSAKTKSTTETCDDGTIACYILQQKGENNSVIVNRGCVPSRARCLDVNQEADNILHSVTCCLSSQCNDAATMKPLVTMIFYFICVRFLFIRI